MNMQPELTIVIPAKNEAENLPLLLTSLVNQDYPLLPCTRVFVADAGSDDGTQAAALCFREQLRISVIPGGLPSVGRNAGANLATTPYVLFMDADTEFGDPGLLRRSMDKMRERRLHCLTTNIRCKNGRPGDHAMFAANNAAQRVAAMFQPFATGMYMLFERERYMELGGFNEAALYAEDYLLSKSVAPRRFGIVDGCVLTSNRRFQKMGRLRIARMFLNTALHTFDREYFLRDQNYWKQAV